jgi:hypothetical protein
LLFVFGTLRPFADVEMAKWLRRNARYLGSATAPVASGDYRIHRSS